MIVSTDQPTWYIDSCDCELCRYWRERSAVAEAWVAQPAAGAKPKLCHVCGNKTRLTPCPTCNPTVPPAAERIEFVDSIPCPTCPGILGCDRLNKCLGVQQHDDAARKPTNPKDAVGVAKVPWSTIPLPVLGEVGLAMMEGARKYGRHNYRAAGVRASVYFDAVVARHLAGWWEGEDMDAESGLSHVTKAIAGLIVLRDSMMQGNWVDDRPPPSKPGWLAGQNAVAASIIEKYPDAKPAHTAEKK